MTRPLEGQTALVTGGSGAIATASATLLARDGAAVVLMGRRQEALERSRRTILDDVAGARVELFAGDATVDADVRGALQAAHELANRLDIVAATVGGGGFKPFLSLEAQDLRADFDLNVVSSFLAIRYGAPLMRPGGSIVCISSTAAKLPFAALASYHVAKGALEALVRAAAEELGASGIRVNAVRPGLTRSEATGAMFATPGVLEAFEPEFPLRRFGEPIDIAHAVRYLAGPEAAWVTGQSFAVDGGNELRRNPNLAPLFAAA
jgi:NAD(P)-dependent dehydrogenase (short-subunit alcohol dehydrogenase family)